MACSCKKRIDITINNEPIELDTKPFETCPLCAFKHLSYALVKYDENILRSIANIYLAYKHLEKNFKEEATLCFNLIKLFFDKNLNKTSLNEVIERLHNLAINYIGKDTSFTEGEVMNLENDLKPLHKSSLYTLAAYELYNFEVGYQDINTPYVIGLLQEAAEFELFLNWKMKIRDLWKQIEANEKITEHNFERLVYAQIKRQERNDGIENFDEYVEKINELVKYKF